ncbi:MAG: enoyl-CoA hydratase [Actinomycetes bacterium]
MTDLILAERIDKVALITLNRPERRNALSAELVVALAESITQADADDTVRAIVLTGTDPAFCAGFDLRNLSAELAETRARRWEGEAPRLGLLPDHATPIVGAINGPAVTGGLELALGCDFLIASDRASFADTHVRVGAMPGGGMTIRLPQLIGIDRARRMSLTGDFIDASTALAWGLVTEVVAHEVLVDRAVAVASSIADLEGSAVREIRSMYDEIGAMTGGDAWHHENQWSKRWMQERFDQARLAASADGIIQRGSQQA